MGFEAVAVHHVDGTIKQARDVMLQASIVEHGKMRLWIDFDHDVDIAVRTAVAPRHRAEHSSPARAACAGLLCSARRRVSRASLLFMGENIARNPGQWERSQR